MHAYSWTDDRDLDPFIKAATDDIETVGLFLSGSRGAGVAAHDSDYDLHWVLSDEAYARRCERQEPLKVSRPAEGRRPRVELLYTCLDRLTERARNPGWWTAGYAASQVLVDKTGQTTAILEAVRQMPQGWRVSIYGLATDPAALPRPVIQLCNPGDGADLSAITANPTLARETWTKKFVEPMQQAASMFEGEHDFTSFARPGHGREHAIRTVHRCTVAARGAKIVVGVEGRGFLWNMVRIMVGTLVEVGLGRSKPEEIATMLSARDRESAGPTAPPHGLYLHWITFEGG